MAIPPKELMESQDFLDRLARMDADEETRLNVSFGGLELAQDVSRRRYILSAQAKMTFTTDVFVPADELENSPEGLEAARHRINEALGREVQKLLNDMLEPEPEPVHTTSEAPRVGRKIIFDDESLT